MRSLPLAVVALALLAGPASAQDDHPNTRSSQDTPIVVGGPLVAGVNVAREVNDRFPGPGPLRTARSTRLGPTGDALAMATAEGDLVVCPIP